MATKETKPYFTANPKEDIINPKTGVINSVCSCQECDSLMCFAKRCENKSCPCKQCKNSKTCLFYSNDKMDIKKSYSNNSKIIQNSPRGSVNCCLANLVDDDSLYNENINNNSKILLKNQTRLILGGLKDQCQDYRLDRSKDISTTQVQSMPIACSRKELNSPTAKLSAQIMDLPYTDFKESISYGKSDMSSYKLRNNSKYDIFKRIREVYEACSCKVCECIVGKSLMIKNDLCKCKSCDCDECTKYMLNQNVDVNTLLITDCIRCTNSNCQGISKKFDEPASCDCKPCDCIQCAESFSKPCDCKPCQCIECNSLSKHNTLIVNSVGEDYNRRNVCQCQPCDCIRCSHGYGTSSLMREMSTGLNRHQNCHCETCVDESCVPDANDTCKCERRNNFMRKPVERDTHEFDIRQAMVTNELPRKHNNEVTKNKYSTIALFAALTSNYTKLAMNKKNLCNCDECECLVCNCAENAVNSIKSSQLFDSVKVLPNISKRSLKTCKCSPCECQYCAKRFKQEGRERNFERTMGKICECDVCDCLNCEESAGPVTPVYNKIHGPSKNYNKFSSRIVCKCDSCECKDCKMENSLGDVDYHDNTTHFHDVKSSAVIYPVKRGKLLTPEMSENRNNYFQDDKHEYYHFVSEGNFTSSSVQKYCPMQAIKSQDFFTYHISPQHSKYSTNSDYIAQEKLPLNVKRQSRYSKNDLETQSYEKSNQSEILQRDTSFKCKNMHTTSQMNKNQNANRYFSEINFTGMSSFHSQSKMSQQGETILSLLVDKYNFDSDVNSCNRLGHDSTDYLIKLPTQTGTKYINEIINLDLNKNLKINRRSITRISGEMSSEMTFQDFNDHAGKHLYVTTAVTNRDKDFNKPNKTSNSSVQVDLFEVYKTALKSKNISKDRQYPKRLKKQHQKTESTQTILKQQKLSKDFVTLNADINSFSRVGGPKIDRRLNKVLINLSEPEITSKFYSPLEFISKYSILNKCILNILKKKEYLSWKWANHSLPVFKNDEIDSFQLDINYERIRRAVQEAKAFSLYLTNLLEKYEKANAEFVSISKKLKNNHNSLLHESSMNSRNNLCLDKINLKRNDSNTKLSNVNLLISKDFTRSTEKPVKYNKNNKDSNVYKNNTNNNCLENNNKIDTIFKLSQECNLDMRNTSTNIKLASDRRLSDYKLNNIQDTNKIPERCQTEEICGACFISEKESNEMGAISKSNDIDIKESYKRYRKLIKRAIIVSKKFNAASGTHILKECVATETSFTSLPIKNDYEKTVNTNKYLEIELNQTEVKSKHRNRKPQAHDADKNIGTSAISSSQQPTSSFKQVTAFNEQVKWPIYKKHFDTLSSEPIENKAGICVFPNIKTGFKEGLLEQTYTENYNKDIVRQENKALAKLQVEVKKLFDMPLLQASGNAFSNNSNISLAPKADLQRHIKELLEFSIVYPATKKCSRKLDVDHSVSTDLEMPNIPSVKSSCDTQKVSFLGLRRVSDHTVLVKWNTPRVMTNVQGYELLVDGRAVQRLINPTKCMAVVTCLPHTDRVLLTIKTILSPVKQCGHIPTSYIVYRPRRRLS